MINLQIANLQICKENSSVFDPDPHWFASNIIFYLRKYIIDYDMPCNYVPKLSQKPKSSLNLNESSLCLYFEKNKYVFAGLRNFKYA